MDRKPDWQEARQNHIRWWRRESLALHLKARLAEINRAYFAIFDRVFDLVRDEQGGNVYCAFHIYGPGKTAKVQCDLACMLSPAVFREFVVGPLTEQCRYLDYSKFHLDGEDALPHLDALSALMVFSSKCRRRTKPAPGSCTNERVHTTGASSAGTTREEAKHEKE